MFQIVQFKHVIDKPLWTYVAQTKMKNKTQKQYMFYGNGS